MPVSSSSAGTKLLLLTVLAAAGMTAAATAATVYAAGDVQRREASRSVAARSVAARSVAAQPGIDAARHWEPLVALADSLRDPLGPTEPIDSGYLAQLVSLVAAPADSSSWIAHQRLALGADDSLDVFRRLAYVQPLPAFWGAREGFAGLDDSRGVPARRYPLLKSLMRRNEAAADSALAHNDVARALQHARENVGVARQLILQPHPIDALVGRAMMRDAAKLLARTALQADQPTLHSAAQRLNAMTDALQIAGDRAFVGRQGGLRDDELRAIARDRRIHPATRFLAMERVVASACLNTREVLFGPSAERHLLIDAMIADTRDIPRVSELQPLFHRTLEHLERDPATFFGPDWHRDTRAEPLSETLLRLMVPATVQARIDVCRAAI